MNFWHHYLLKSPLRANIQVVVIIMGGSDMLVIPQVYVTLDITCDTSSQGTHTRLYAQLLFISNFQWRVQFLKKKIRIPIRKTFLYDRGKRKKILILSLSLILRWLKEHLVQLIINFNLTFQFKERKEHQEQRIEENTYINYNKYILAVHFIQKRLDLKYSV